MDVVRETLMSTYDEAKELKEFDESKAGVKGLVDSGVTQIPQFFIHAPEDLPKEEVCSNGIPFRTPIIDFQGVRDNSERRKTIVEELRKASETWGFFQMVNHGIPVDILDELIQCIKQFHEQPAYTKKEIYSRDPEQKVRFYSNGILGKATWKDSLACNFDEDQLDSDEHLPLVCRKIMVEYMKNVIKLKETLSELLSEALGLSADYLKRMRCLSCKSLVGHYYPACPEPDLTVGILKHTDPLFLTILLQDNIGGLQVLHQNQWVDVPAIHGALLTNIGDLLQIITNDKFKTVEHRVLAQKIGPRISVATFATLSPSIMSWKSYVPYCILSCKQRNIRNKRDLKC